MVVAQPIGDKDTGTKHGDILNSVSQNQNRRKSIDQRKDRRSKSHPHVRVRQKLRHWTGVEGEEGQVGLCSPVDTIPRLPVLRPESDDVIRRRRVLRKFSTSISISKRFWSRLSEDQTEGNRMEQWAKLRTSVSLGTVISRAFGDNKEKRRLVINPIKVKQEIRKVRFCSCFAVTFISERYVIILIVMHIIFFTVKKKVNFALTMNILMIIFKIRRTMLLCYYVFLHLIIKQSLYTFLS